MRPCLDVSPEARDDRGRCTRRALWLGAVLAFAVVLWGGYDRTRGWTGFRGNTLWDWLHLFLPPIFLAPILVPTVLISAVLAPLEVAAVGVESAQDPGPTSG